MFKLKRFMFIGYILLGVGLISLGANYFSMKSNDVEIINNFVASGPKENSDDENYDIEKHEENGQVVNLETKLSESNENQSKAGKAIKAELTAYCNDPRSSNGWGAQTAMQTETRVGVIAAPKNIPLGSEMYIPDLKSYKSDGMFDVEDRGGAIKVKEDGTYVIDVWVPTYEEAINFGRKNVTVYLVE